MKIAEIFRDVKGNALPSRSETKSEWSSTSAASYLRHLHGDDCTFVCYSWS